MIFNKNKIDGSKYTVRKDGKTKIGINKNRYVHIINIR